MSAKTYDELATLAADAKPRPVSPGEGNTNPDDDYGSDRQVGAQNLFFNELQKVLPAKEFAELEEWCLKATTEEMLDEGLRYAREHFGVAHPAP
jgi:hypothetical protein